MSKSTYVGVDIGTSGVKAALFDLRGDQLDFSYREYPMICNQQGMGELDPHVVFESFITVIKECAEKASERAYGIQAVGLSTQMHSFLAVNDEGNCVTNIITWADTRATEQADYIKENFDCQKLYQNTGCRVQHPMYPLSKILWLKFRKPEVYKRVDKFISIKEYILFRVCGEFLVDITDASASGCFNIHNFSWDEDVLKEVLGTTSSKFGNPVECTYVIRNIKSKYMNEMGLKNGIPFIIGSGDGIMASIGCGALDYNYMSCTVGTSGALRVVVNKPLLDPLQRTWCYCFTKNAWVAGGAINNGGIVLRWIRDEFRKQFEFETRLRKEKDIYSLFDRYASEVPAGCEGLIFLPYLTGERSPNWNAKAKGTIHGITLAHGKRHLIRAAMEGVMYRLFSVFEVLSELIEKPSTIVTNGGYVNSDIWLQIQADVFSRELAVARVGEAAALGAAYTAMVAEGAVSGFKERLPAMEPLKIVKPLKDNIEVYRREYSRFCWLYSKLNQE